MALRHAWMGLLLVGCSGENPAELGQFGEDEDLICVESGVEALSEEDDLVLEHETTSGTVGEVMALAEGRFEETLTWEATGEQTTVRVDSWVTPGSAERVLYEPADADIPDENCPDRLRFEVEVRVITADGRLDEAYFTDALSEGTAVYASATVEGLEGSLDVQAMAASSDPIQADVVEIKTTMRSGTVGAFSGQIVPIRSDVPGEDVTPLGGWPGEVE